MKKNVHLILWRASYQKGKSICAKTKSWSCLCCSADESMNKNISLCPIEKISQSLLPLILYNILRWKSLKDKTGNHPVLIKRKVVVPFNCLFGVPLIMGESGCGVSQVKK